MADPATRPVLLVTRNFPPLVGGMENVNRQLLQALAVGGPVRLFGPAGARSHAPEADAVSEAPIRPLSVFLARTMVSVLGEIWRSRPRIVMGGSGLMAPIVWVASRLIGARSAMYLHGLDIIAPSKTYQALWLPFIRASDLVFVNSRHTATLARSRGVPPERIRLLHPGTYIHDPKPERAQSFLESHGLSNRLVLLSVGRLTQRKGLEEFVRHALPRVAAAHPSCVLLVIGDEAVDALHARGGSERARIMAAARDSGVEENLRFLGHCDQATLAAAYEGATLHVFPVLELPGDVEGFGMVALESAAHGLQTIGFAVGGIPDAVSEGTTGRLVQAGNYEALASALLEMAETAKNTAAVKACREFAEGKSWSRFGERLRVELSIREN